MQVKRKIPSVLCLLIAFYAIGQPVSYHFRHYTTTDGLGDGVIRGIAQDKYGFMWFGSVNGLTIYNGYTSKVMEANTQNPYAFKDINITSLCRDSNGTMWLAQPSGIYQYEYATGHFLLQQGISGLPVTKMFTAGDEFLYLVTKNGLEVFNTQTKKIQIPSTDTASLFLLNRSIRDICSTGNKVLYLATDTGIVVYNGAKRKATLLLTHPTSINNLTQIAGDKKGRLWCSNGAMIFRINTNKEVVSYPSLNGVTQPSPDNQINDLFVDASERVWVATNRTGLCLYNETENTFSSLRSDPLQTQSLSTNLVTSIFQDTDETIWIGTEGYGLNYFNPERDFFHSLLPGSYQSPTLPDNWCRAFSEDKQGQWWLATATGVSVYNPTTDSYINFQNKEGSKKVLHSNSVRSVLCASDGTIWIGTADGLNRFHPQTGQMDFIGEKDGMPLSFFWHLTEDKNQTIWIASRDGIYNYNPATNHFDNLQTNQLLQPFCRFRTRTIFIDSRNRIWFGLDGKGVLLYDKKNGLVKHWSITDKDSNTISNDLISSITEDKVGTVWISTYSGLNAFDERKNNFKHFYKSEGLLSNKISCLIADNANQLWMGTSKGLCMMDSLRTRFKTFGMEDGLASIEFNDQSAFRTSNGQMMFPTYKGFLYFNPAHYHIINTSFSTYLSSFQVYNKDFLLNSNPEAVEKINLHWNQNFFSFTIVSPNYIQAEQTMYAYWLEPFDKAWIFTKERKRNYTNVPGGQYVLHIKATTNLQHPNVPETNITITIGTVFYKTWWFIALMSILFLFLLYRIYLYRIRQHKKMVLLQTKAQALEKEKAVVMYESLKQQLNPHFLFNSLSSLSGLIQKDQSAAKIFLDQLSKIYRYILKSGDSEFVRISEDLKLAQIYLQLQQTRFGTGLQLKIELNDEILNRRIAPVTIQNLIENAIKHNMIDSDSPLLISITNRENYLIVTNNLQKKSFVEGSNQQGLQNMKTLYRYLCGQPIITEETPDYFIVKIPFV